MSLPFETSPPPVARVSDGIPRPLWSVMIPTFNCAKYLRQTLESVLIQDPGANKMQIEVVDDCSTKDDPEAVVKEIGKGRVLFYRKPKNEGAISNFNTCIQRSCGQLVHILHGDDFVSPGFYARIEKEAIIHPSCSAFFVRNFIVSEDNVIESLSGRLSYLETPSRSPQELLYGNVLYTPAAVIRRDFYEIHGGFLLALVHVADWEMWLRAIIFGSGMTINEILASYRSFPGNDSGRLARTGENLRDSLRLASILAMRLDSFNHDRFKAMVARAALHQANFFQSQKNVEAELANRSVLRELTPPFHVRLRHACGAFLRELKIH